MLVPELEEWALVGLRVTAIAVVAVAAFLAIRGAVGVAVRHLLEARAAEAQDGAMSAFELERRVRTIERLGLRVAGGLVGAVAALMVLDAFEINIGPAIAGLGVAGIAVGFGAQALVRDWLAGIFIVLENQYSQGDVVRIAGVDGVVEDFSLRRTVLRDLDGTVHTVPNGQIIVASNMTRLWARVNLDVAVAYDTDIAAATELIDRIGAELAGDPDWSDRILEPPAVVRISELAESGVTLKVLGQVRAAQQWSVTGELRKRLLAAFADAGIEIPFPHRVIVSRSGASPGDEADSGTPGD